MPKESETAMGTGGTKLKSFLKELIEETKLSGTENSEFEVVVDQYRYWQVISADMSADFLHIIICTCTTGQYPTIQGRPMLQ